MQHLNFETTYDNVQIYVIVTVTLHHMIQYSKVDLHALKS